MKHYFLGSNTPYGFKSFYNIVNKDGKHLFILKGGSGVGKHTFMKKIADYMVKRSFNVEYCHCSNDVDSLDGIVISDIGVAIIDGTSPHTVDPQLPGCFDEIIDLGKYINPNQLVPQKNKIEKLISTKKQKYNGAYIYLACAKQMYDYTEQLISSCLYKDKMNDILSSLPKAIVNKSNGYKGGIKHIFASAYTSKGYVDYIDTLLEAKPTIAIKNYKCLNSKVMSAIFDYAEKNKIGMTICHSIIDPSQIDHILFDDLNIISVDEYNKFNEADETIALKDTVDKNKLLDYFNDITWNNDKFDSFVKNSIEVMSSCSAIHNELEAIYTPAMNFDGVDAELEAVIKKINSYIS